MPASSARATVRFCSVGSPFVNRPPMAPQPNPRTETLGPLRPIVRYCIVLLLTASSRESPLPQLPLPPPCAGEGGRYDRLPSPAHGGGAGGGGYLTARDCTPAP